MCYIEDIRKLLVSVEKCLVLRRLPSVVQLCSFCLFFCKLLSTFCLQLWSFQHHFSYQLDVLFLFHSLITISVLSLTDFFIQIYWKKRFLPIVKEIRLVFFWLFCLFFNLGRSKTVITESSDLNPLMKPFYRRVFKNIFRNIYQ